LFGRDRTFPLGRSPFGGPPPPFRHESYFLLFLLILLREITSGELKFSPRLETLSGVVPTTSPLPNNFRCSPSFAGAVYSSPPFFIFVRPQFCVDLSWYEDADLPLPRMSSGLQVSERGVLLTLLLLVADIPPLNYQCLFAGRRQGPLDNLPFFIQFPPRCSS